MKPGNLRENLAYDAWRLDRLARADESVSPERLTHNHTHESNERTEAYFTSRMIQLCAGALWPRYVVQCKVILDISLNQAHYHQHGMATKDVV